jgi:signal transduction histidine kinase
MTRKFIIVFVITTLFTALVVGFSWFYLSQFVRQQLQFADETASEINNQLRYSVSKAVPDFTSTRTDTSNPRAMRDTLLEYLRTDSSTNETLESVVGSSPIVYDMAILDPNGVAILDTTPARIGKVAPDRPPLKSLRDAGFRHQLRLIYGTSTVYDTSLPVELDKQTLGTVRVGISTVFMRNELTIKLQQAAFFSALAIFCSLVLGAAVSHVALGPLKTISRDLDTASAGDPMPTEEAVADEVGLVSLKIAHLGQQIRDTNQIFSALKDNVEQVMANLQDGLVLFTRESRVVLVSASAEKFLSRPRREILGRKAEDIFADGSVLGTVVLSAFQKQKALGQYEFDALDGRRVQVSLDFIQEKGTPIGALLTMRDVESVKRIEDEIEISRRLSSAGRVTRGVAHEVKNPINAIVLHLQLLQNKFKHADPEARRHMDIIGNEIHRLDRVVQILVDFTRPRDLRLEEADLRKILEEVAVLAAPDLSRRGIRLVKDLPKTPLLVRIDPDLMKQAVLNLVINGVQAMKRGGTLTIVAYRDDETIVGEIQDQGVGIPPEAQEKIFELYFTTKGDQGGSGIGLAQTYQIMQWHYGSVEFDSIVGAGTTFRLRLPAVMAKPQKQAELTV